MTAASLKSGVCLHCLFAGTAWLRSFSVLSLSSLLWLKKHSAASQNSCSHNHDKVFKWELTAWPYLGLSWDFIMAVLILCMLCKCHELFKCVFALYCKLMTVTDICVGDNKVQVCTNLVSVQDRFLQHNKELCS